MVGLADADPYRRASDEILGLAGVRQENKPDLSNAQLPHSGTFNPQTALPQAPAPQPQPRGIIKEGYDAFLHSLGPQNIALFGAGLRSLGAVSQQEDMYEAGYKMENYGENLDIGEAPTMPRIEDAESLARWMSGGLGQGLGSVGAPLMSATAGGLAGFMAGGPAGATLGAITAGFAVNDIILAGEAYKQFEESGVDNLKAAQAAQTIAPAMAALDTLGLVKVLKGPGKKASDGLLKYIGKRMAQGASVEAATEMAQGVIREITDANLSGDMKATERALAILEEGAVAGLTGGVLGGAAGSVTSRRRTAEPTEPTTPTEDPQQPAPPTDETVVPPEEEVLEEIDEEALPTVEEDLQSIEDDPLTIRVELPTTQQPEPEDATPMEPAVEDQEYTAKLQEGMPIEQYRRPAVAPSVIAGMADSKGWQGQPGAVLKGKVGDSDWYTNGRLIVKGELPQGFNEINSKSNTPDKVGKTIMPFINTPSNTEAMEVVSAQQITNPTNNEVHDMLWFADKNDNYAAVDQESVQFVEREYGDVDWSLAKSDRQGFVKATKDGEVVAVAIPYKGNTPSHVIDIAKGEVAPQEQVDPAEQVESVRFKRTGEPLKTWHGSGAVFDKFDFSYMGTGEGAQAFGWGMYVAEKKKVAKTYRDDIVGAGAKEVVLPDGNRFKVSVADGWADMEVQTDFDFSKHIGIGRLTSSLERDLNESFQLEVRDKVGSDLDITPEIVSESVQGAVVSTRSRLQDRQEELEIEIQEMEEQWQMNADPDEEVDVTILPEYDELVDVRDSLRELDTVEQHMGSNIPAAEINVNEVKGALYEIGVDIAPDEMLYWDDTLKNMEPAAQEKIRNALNDRAFSGGVENTDQLFNDKTGEIIHRMLKRRLGSNRAATQHLLKHGIRANKFLDAVSRSQRNGTYNYVVFDPDAMDIIARYKRPAPRSPGYIADPTMTTQEVQDVVDRMTDKWDSNRLPPVRVIKSLDELPDDVKGIISQEVGDMTFTEQAMHVKKGDGTSEVYVISDNVQSANDVRKAIAHEVVGHFSVQEMMGNEFPKILRQMQQTRNSPKLKPYWDMVDHLYGDMTEDVKAEEVIAFMAETRVDSPVMTRAIAAVRRFLRSLGLRLSYSYSEIRAMIANAARRLEKEADPRSRVEAADPDPVSNRVPDAVRVAFSVADRAQAAKTPQPQMRATHSMSVSNLMSALDRGTLIAPSIAVTPADQPHRWGGGASADVVFRANVIDPARFTITEGDAWTPTVPSTYYAFKGNTQQREQTRDNFQRDIDALPPSRKKKISDRFNPRDIIDYRGRFETDYSAMDTLEQIYQHQTRKRNRINSDEGKAWLAEYLEKISPPGTVQESFFAGTSYTGAHRHAEATPENMLKDMRRQQREDRMDFGGHGKIWAKWRPKTKTKAKMREAVARVEKDKDKYERIREELTAEIIEIGDGITSRVKVGERRHFDFDTGLDILLEAGPDRARLERAMRSYRDDATLPDWLFDDITEHFRKVREMPLQFLEAKALREISLRDVASVVLPKGTSSEVAKRLRQKGIAVKIKNDSMTDAELAKLQSSGSNVRFKRKVSGEPTDKPAGRYEFKVIDPTKPIDTIFRLLIGGSLTIGPDGNMKYSKKAQEFTRKILMDMRPNKDSGAVARMIDTWLQTSRHAWMNRYGTPKDFIVRDRQRAAHSYEIMSELITFLEKIQDANMTNKEYEALQDVLEGKALDDKKMNQMAPEIRKSIDDYGRQLVDLGLLNEETYLENLGSYMHRSYRMYEFDSPEIVRWGRNLRKKSRQALRGDELKMRGMTHRFDDKRLFDAIPEGLVEQAKTVKDWKIVDSVNPDGKVIKRNYIPAGMEDSINMPQAPEGGELIDRGNWKMRKAKGRGMVLWRDYTPEERKRNEEIRDARYNLIKTYELLAHDISTGKFFKDISENDAWFRAEIDEDEYGVISADQAAKSFAILAEADWVKVPEGTIEKSSAKRWGALAGGYIRAPLWRDINELEKMQNPGTWGWLLREWKANKTARSPTVHFNNFVGNWILSELYDFRQGDIIRGIKEFRAKGPIYLEAVQHGVFDSGYVRSELLGGADSKKIIDEIIEEVKKVEKIEPMGMAKMWMKASGGFKTGARAMEKAYQVEDELFRLISFMNDRGMGLSPEAAAENAINRFMNYDIRAPLPNALRRTVFPFLSYTYAFVPAWLKAFSNKPWKIAKIAAIGYGISMLSDELIEGDSEDERRVMSERDSGYTWAGLPKTLRLPMTSQGDPVYIGLQRVLPGGGLTDSDAGHVSGLPEWLLVSGPMLIAAELFLNRLSFNGQEIYSSVDNGMEKSKKIATYMWRGAMPNFPMLPYSYSTDMLTRSWTGETDLFGRNYSPVIAGIRQFGPKLYPFDYDTQLAYRMMDIDRDMRAYQKKMWQAAMDRKNKSISEETYKKTLIQVQNSMKKLSEKAREVTGN